MPFRRRYRRRRPRRPYSSRNALYRTGKRFASNFFHKGVGHAIASEAKRFINDLGSKAAPNSVTSAAANNHLLTQIPRNLASTSRQSDNREGRKVWIKGVTIRLAMSPGIGSGFQRLRCILVRQNTLSLSLVASDFDAPIGCTRGVMVLMDKYVILDGTSETNGNSYKMLNKYVNVNAPLFFGGAQVDGSDTDEGTLRLYTYTDDPSAATYYGACTVHYHEQL